MDLNSRGENNAKSGNKNIRFLIGFLEVIIMFCQRFGWSYALKKKYTTQNLLRITFSFNDLMLKTNRLKKDFFSKDRLIFGLDDPVANMSIRHVYYA